MAKKLNSVLGVDIGSQSIKVCELRTQGKEAMITGLAIGPTPEGAVDHTGVYNPEAVGDALKKLVSSNGMSVGQVVVSIAGQASVLVRTLEVPKMNDTELKQHMEWEINRNIPFAESTVVSDFKALGGDDPNSPNMDVVMAIAPQSAIDTVIQCVKRAGKSVHAIDVEPLSIARSLTQSYDDTLGDKTVCMVDIGHTSSSINIYHGSKLIMPRQVPIGGHMFTQAIADAMQVGFAEAERSKCESLAIPESAAQDLSPGNTFGGGDFAAFNPFADEPAPIAEPTISTPAPYTPFDPSLGYDDPPVAAEPVPVIEPMYDATPVAPEAYTAVFQAISPILAEFAAEIRRSIDYFQSRGGVVDRVELLGGGAKLKGLGAYLTKSIGIECDSYDPMRRLNMGAKKVGSDFLDEHRLEFAIAVGNGLHAFFD